LCICQGETSQKKKSVKTRCGKRETDHNEGKLHPEKGKRKDLHKLVNETGTKEGSSYSKFKGNREKK